MITKDKEGNLILSDSAPEKAYQDSQKVTAKLTEQAEKVGRLEAENAALHDQLIRDAKKITVTLKQESEKVQLHDVMWGITTISNTVLDVNSIEINNVDEADKFLTTVLESEISKERDELQEKFIKLETKLDEKDRDLTNKGRELKSSKLKYQDSLTDLDDHYTKELNRIRKTARGKVEKQLIEKDIEIAEQNNQLAIERQEANLRETDLLGKLDYFKEANTALETKVTELKDTLPRLSGRLGNFISKMTGYKKAAKALERFTLRSSTGVVGGRNPFARSF